MVYNNRQAKNCLRGCVGVVSNGCCQGASRRILPLGGISEAACELSAAREMERVFAYHGITEWSIPLTNQLRRPGVQAAIDPPPLFAESHQEHCFG